MVYYWLHLLYIFVCSKLLWKDVDLISDQSRNRRVSLLDCDTFRYMSNAKYAYYMDFIRFEKMFRSKLFANTVKKGIYPVLGSQKIIYKRPIKMWTTFKITLVMEGWDNKWVYHSQVFEQHNEVCAIGYTKAAFWKNKKAQDLKTILKNCGVNIVEMKVPKEIHDLFNSDYDLLRGTRIQ
ncbi:acyl-CoA thioesterase [Arenibacter aquaticus]|uniref:Acyl-CoA thioesterase n=1 Tax=Arenibacter aquaticus TaxID=2489054 RepID=A0A430K2D2_9FLAO|nr:acyl-CoA thioesterase [Arenibacter aquaticus]RTE53084.1 acyl-CoA thioesterase [Arenibacter aquaticus]